MKCRPLRSGDQMQCHCGLAWDLGEDKPECRDRIAASEIVQSQERTISEVMSKVQEIMCKPILDCIQKTLDEDKPECKNVTGNLKFSPDGMMLDSDGNRSIFDDVDE